MVRKPKSPDVHTDRFSSLPSLIPDETPDPANISQVNDLDDLFRKMEKIDGASRTLHYIPQMRRQIDDVGRRLERLDVTLDLVNQQMDRLEKKIDIRTHHDCHQAPAIQEMREEQKTLDMRIEQEALQSVKVVQRIEDIREDVGEVTEEVKAIHAMRRQNLMTLFGSLVGLLLTIASAIWFVAQLTSRVDQNERSRQEAQQRLERDLDKIVRSTQESEVTQQITALQQLLEGRLEEEARYRKAAPSGERRKRN